MNRSDKLHAQNTTHLISRLMCKFRTSLSSRESTKECRRSCYREWTSKVFHSMLANGHIPTTKQQQIHIISIFWCKLLFVSYICIPFRAVCYFSNANNGKARERTLTHAKPSKWCKHFQYKYNRQKKRTHWTNSIKKSSIKKQYKTQNHNRKKKYSGNRKAQTHCHLILFYLILFYFSCVNWIELRKINK